MATYLDSILDAHRAAAAADRRPVGRLLEEASGMALARGFAAALVKAEGLAVIGEVKRRSPSRGDLNPDLVAGTVAEAFAEGGAACLSVLTDGDYFGGSAADLAEARRAVELPVLRKDFTVSERDVLDARLMGADAVLLIVAALDGGELAAFRELAEEVGLDALVEVHDEREMERALDAGAEMIGVNQRDLATFEVDRARAERVAQAMPDDVVKVAESGIRDGADAQRLRDAGYDAVLVGEALVTAPDMAAKIRELRCS